MMARGVYWSKMTKIGIFTQVHIPLIGIFKFGSHCTQLILKDHFTTLKIDYLGFGHISALRTNDFSAIVVQICLDILKSMKC